MQGNVPACGIYPCRLNFAFNIIVFIFAQLFYKGRKNPESLEYTDIAAKLRHVVLSACESIILFFSKRHKVYTILLSILSITIILLIVWTKLQFPNVCRFVRKNPESQPTKRGFSIIWRQRKQQWRLIVDNEITPFELTFMFIKN